ncbi:hypothetical protein WJX81_002352 [Elliptochloris bilobata]|uniref:Uncharacterized protein n=1 Tax=Elliptochloris bilobata TaxID=381761 RepID=A0AAW1RNL4_9CHLO
MGSEVLSPTSTSPFACFATLSSFDALDTDAPHDELEESAEELEEGHREAGGARRQPRVRHAERCVKAHRVGFVLGAAEVQRPSNANKAAGNRAGWPRTGC